ncbi:replication initiation protein [Paraclostridium sordellii]|jgi:plasmid replication initiation protein|uniref:replication initiation protein n=1 Tax=Paraclostridium sordellii TaxID=1505 RepID=UPI0005DB6DE5|nr:replication initiation protein [Paeniclostridium sordellii]CEP50421.1 putative replication initiator protein [[Clostridium] sordellii] [Paeniclostridium sordellii]CEQ26994.1 putative replication initiator protein [[Clostridium] sordellii] [Paeniclostridium sordellii]DAU04069.1 MAG TPA: DNA REPLICATION protein [Caudoviricetes sp.]
MEEKRDEILLKDNILVKTKYDLTTIENKLFTMILFKLQKEGNLLKCKMTHSQIKQIVKNKNENTIRGISDILDKLSDKRIHIQEIKDNKINSVWYKYRLINGYSYDDEYNTFEIESSEKIYSLVCKKFKGGGYTPVNLAVFLSLKNPYAQRLYDLLRLWSGTKNKISYSVNDLKMYLMLEEAYAEYGNFKRRVINPAIKELNSSGYFEIKVEEVKSGRKVETINFIVKDLDKRVYFDKKVNQNVIEIDKNNFKEIESESQKKSDEFYVPNKKLFTSKTLENFKSDFENYDFKDSTYKKLLQEAILVTLEKDDEEKIKVKSYNYFKQTLENKIKNNKTNGVRKQKTRFHNINQTFEKYTSDELEKILLENQKDKFKAI